MKTLLTLCIFTGLQASATDVKLERVPENGVQPQVAVQTDGTVHLVYLTGQPGGADIRYTRRAAAASEWAKPVTVNSIPKTAVAVGTIRGAQLALGQGGRVHVVWNGAALKGDHAHAPLYYTRMENGKFEAQRSGHDLESITSKMLFS